MYMNEKNQSNQNIADIGATLWGNELQYNGASWVQNQHFWLMGTISFFEQRKGIVFEDERQKQLRFLFNALDRELLPRKYTHTDIKKPQKTLKEAYHKQQVRQRHKANVRLERVVYDETGANRDYSHAHFFIKGTTNNWRLRGIQTELIKDKMKELWQQKNTPFGTIDFKTNSNSLHQTGYGYKEDKTDLQKQLRHKNKTTQLTTNTGTFNNTCSFLLN